jgi:PAS domain S-box-containing protein
MTRPYSNSQRGQQAGLISAEELRALRERLAEAEETLRAIRAGEVDGILVDDGVQPAMYTLRSASDPYRALVETMSEGALTVSPTGIIVYSNEVFARMVGLPRGRVTGARLSDFVPALPEAQSNLWLEGMSGREFKLQATDRAVDVYISTSQLTVDGEQLQCLIVTDLSRQQSRLRHEAIVQSSADAIYSVDTNFIVETWNSGAEQLFQYAAAEAIGRPLHELIVPADRIDEYERAKARVLAGNKIEMETARIAKHGQRIDASIKWTPIKSQTGWLLGIAVISRDISAQKRAERALAASEERLRYALSASNAGVWSWTVGTNEVIWSPENYELHGVDPAKGPPTYLTWEQVVHPDDVEPTNKLIRATVEGEFPEYRAEFRVRHPTKGLRWVLGIGNVERDASGKPIRMSGINIDITARKQIEQHTELLKQEVNHRAKNLLAVVQAMARQTAARSDPAAFAERFGDRLAGLAASHDLLLRSEWRGIDMRELARSQLAHFTSLTDGRVILEGPPLQLTPAGAQTIGMVFHELATNAIKYGALSNRKGVVRLTWELTGEGARMRLAMQWSERGGPPPSEPKHHGFGHTVMVTMPEQALDAKISLLYPSTGLIWEFSAPGDPLLARADPQLSPRLF